MMAHVTSLSALDADPAVALAYRMVEPAPESPKACVILLHGVGGSETDLAGLADGLGADTLVLLPRGPLAIGPGQHAWFRVSFTSDGPQINQQEADAVRVQLKLFVDQAQRRYGVAPEHTLIAGFSQGGIMSASLALSAPEGVRAFGILSGRILPELEPYLASRDRLAHLNAWVSHGEQDSTLPVFWAERSKAWLDALGVQVDYRLYSAPHAFTSSMRNDFSAWVTSTLYSDR